MEESIRNKYSNENLDGIIIYFMKTILNFEKTGIEKLPLENNFDEPIKSYLELAVDLMIDGQPPETAEVILGAEYDVMLSSGKITAEIAICLRMIKELSCHIHYDEDCYEYLLFTDNLWGNEVFAYASRTFYPNIPEELKDKHHIHELIKYLPQEIFRLDDF